MVKLKIIHTALCSPNFQHESPGWVVAYCTNDWLKWQSLGCSKEWITHPSRSAEYLEVWVGDYHKRLRASVLIQKKFDALKVTSNWVLLLCNLCMREIKSMHYFNINCYHSCDKTDVKRKICIKWANNEPGRRSLSSRGLTHKGTTNALICHKSQLICRSSDD